MELERFARVKKLLLSVADLGEAKRSAFLDQACKDDPDLRREVESILAHENDATGMMKTAGAAPSGNNPQSGAIGPYRVLEPIGEGGMGIVYLAEQTTPVRRRVALKVIKQGMDSKQVVARFESERQALALMDHPAIAKVLDAGTTSEGRPYFAMEFVQGIPITEYCDRRRLGTPERLELFQRVCEGVQHAHQKAVIHRDLKPSNILVSDVDGKPQPRIIDFGVAKATTRKLTEKTMYTAMGQLIGTPEYMSPEQANLTAEDVDTRTDVYSLGVILYELLAGALPFDSTQLRKAGFDGIICLLREKDPPRPSTKVSSLGEKTTEVAEKRRTEPRRLVGQLKGDLDWIVMRSLEKDRNRRYGSPQELAQDIRRHLEHQPVLAGPPSAVYRARKFMKRNRIAVGFGATILLAVALGFVLLTVQNARIAAARDEAESVVTTLEAMLASVDPTKSGRDVTVKEMLDETAKTLGEKFKSQPLIEARLRHTVGKTYGALGEYAAAEGHLRRAVEIRYNRLGIEDPATLGARDDLTRALLGLGSFEEAEAIARETAEVVCHVFGEEHPKAGEAKALLASTIAERGRYEEAEAIFREVLEIQRHALGEEHPLTLAAKSGLADALFRQGHVDEPEALLKPVLAARRRTLGREHLETLNTAVQLANLYHDSRRYEEAEALGREVLEIQRRVLGEEHPQTLSTMRLLAFACMRRGHLDEAEALMQRTLEIQRHVLGSDHPQTLETMLSLGELLCRQGRLAEAEALTRRTLAISRRVRGDDHHRTNDVRYNLACFLAMQGRGDEAISVLQEALDNGYSGPKSWKQDGRRTIRDDPDLAALHGDPEFEAIVEELRRRNGHDERAVTAPEMTREP